MSQIDRGCQKVTRTDLENQMKMTTMTTGQSWRGILKNGRRFFEISNHLHLESLLAKKIVFQSPQFFVWVMVFHSNLHLRQLQKKTLETLQTIPLWISRSSIGIKPHFPLRPPVNISGPHLPSSPPATAVTPCEGAACTANFLSDVSGDFRGGLMEEMVISLDFIVI